MTLLRLAGFAVVLVKVVNGFSAVMRREEGKKRRRREGFLHPFWGGRKETETGGREEYNSRVFEVMVGGTAPPTR